MMPKSRRLVRSPRRLSLSLAVLAVAVTAATDLHADEDDRGCRFVDGPFHSSLVAPPACQSPVGLCTHGELGGDFPAIYDFTFSTLQPANDPNDPTEFVYTGRSTVTTPRGVIHTNDSGVIHMAPNAPAPFVTTATIASGTDRFAGASGVFVASGSLDTATGNATGTFIAQICRGERER